MQQSSHSQEDEQPIDGIYQQDLRVLLDHAPDAIARFDRQLRHVYVNEATGRENGLPASEFHGKTMEDLGHEERVCNFINDNLRGVFETGKERTQELWFDGPLGGKWFQCRMAPEFNETGEVEFALVISRDISEQRKAELLIRESESRTANAVLARMLAHEINNPLTAVVYALHLLKQNQSLNEQGRTMLGLATENLDRVTAISKALLSLYANLGIAREVEHSHPDAELSPDGSRPS